ncbi:MAG: alanine:cation symporter family protein [Bacilli bacterium]|nr:alanine:cation symporter family protein [Bacilli bacterium]
MLDTINNFIWLIAGFLIVFSGLYFSFALKGVQFRFTKMFKSLFSNKDSKGVKPYQTLMMVLAGRIGVGSIAGVALAIYLGGLGSIFWMWATAFIGASNSFAETVLGIIYKEKDEDNIYKGGPSYYIKRGLNNKFLGGVYAVIVIFSYIGGFLSIQSNTITKSINEITTVSPVIIGIIISIVTSFIIFGGIKRIASTASKIVPFITISYVSIALYICITNIEIIPVIFKTIVQDAFHFKPFISGFLTTMIIGIQRGIFSNEAGLGTGAIASSTVETKDSISQGYLQMIGVYITTLLICTSTAIIILTSPYKSLVLNDANGIEITQFAFSYHLGDIGNYLVFISIILFSFTTILTGYYDGEASLKYFFKNVKKRYLLYLKLSTIIILFLGCMISSTTLWNFVDILVAFEAIINIYAIFSLRKEVENRLRNAKVKKT